MIKSATSKVSRRQFFTSFKNPSQPRVSLASSVTGFLNKIVFAYERGLPAGMVVGSEQFKYKLKTAGFQVVVLCQPLSALAQDADVVLVAEDLVKVAQQRVPDAQIIPLKQFKDSSVYDELIGRLIENVELKAEIVGAATEEIEQPKIVKYRGYQKID